MYLSAAENSSQQNLLKTIVPRFLRKSWKPFFFCVYLEPYVKTVQVPSWSFDIVSEMWLCDRLWTTLNNIHIVSVWLCCNAERIILRRRWGRSVPLKLLLRPLCSNLAQSTAAKFHELYRQALNPFLWSWSPTVIQADAIKKCLFMRLLTSKTFHQTNCASVTGLPPFLHVSEILSPLEAILQQIILGYRIFYLPELN